MADQDNGEPTDVKTPPTSPQPPAKSDDITPERYAGLQRVVSKKDEELAKLREQISTLAEQLETIRAEKNSSETKASGVAQQLEALQTRQQELESTNAELTARLSRQGIILTDFPELSPFSEDIRPGTTEAEFRANAEAFRARLSKYASGVVTTTLEGAVPPTSDLSNKQLVSQETEREKLWSTVYATAGVAGKESEYEEAYSKLLELDKQRS